MGNHEDLVVATAEEIVGAIASNAERLAMFRRRFVTALEDSGLLDIVGPAQRLVLVGEALHGDDRAEDLVLDVFVVLAQPGQDLSLIHI